MKYRFRQSFTDDFGKLVKYSTNSYPHDYVYHNPTFKCSLSLISAKLLKNKFSNSSYEENIVEIIEDK